MIHLEFTQQEAKELRGILEEDLAELRFEIRDTDSVGFREHLKEREWFIKHLLERLPDHLRPVPA